MLAVARKPDQFTSALAALESAFVRLAEKKTLAIAVAGLLAIGGARASASHPACAEARDSGRIQLSAGERYVRLRPPGQSHARARRSISRRCRS